MTVATARGVGPAGVRLVYEVAGRSVVGKVRARNEDALGCARFSDDTLLLVVADGMGRYAGGDIASRVAVAEVERAYGSAGATPGRAAAPADAIADALYAAFESAHARLCAMAVDDPGLHEMGTTLVAAVLTPSGVGWCNVGDSRLLWLTGEGTLRRVSRDHNVAQALMDVGQLDEEEASTHPMAANLTSFVGPEMAWEAVRVSPAPGEPAYFVPRPGDVLALCTDGVTGTLTGRALAELLGRAGDASSRAQRVVDAVMRTDAHDNATLYVVVVADGGDDGGDDGGADA